MSIDIRQLYCKSGRPIRGLESVMMANSLGCQSMDFQALDTLKAMAKSGELQPADVYRYKGNGSPSNPGRLARYLFDLPDGNEVRRRNARITWLAINRLRSSGGML